MAVRNGCIVALLFSLCFTVEGEKAFGIQIPHPDDQTALDVGQVPSPGADAKAELHGRVLDSAGGSLEGVTVEVLSRESKVPYRTGTNAQGEFVILGVAKGILKVSLRHPEFEPRDQQFLWPGSATAVLFTLQPRSLSESITVTATRTSQPSKDTPPTVI